MAGKSRLVTHNDPLNSANRLQNTGFYAAHSSEEKNLPIEGKSIPEELQLHHTGTRVSIIGFDTNAYPKWKDEIIASAAKHFFYAIHHQKLNVIVSSSTSSEEINNQTLESALNKCGADDPTHWYYRCIRDETPEVTRSSGQFNDMGKMRVWINTHDDAPKRLAHINRRGMFITDRRQFGENPFCPYGSAGWAPWCAVSMADSDETDSFIRALEPPAHDAVEVKRLKNYISKEETTSELRFQRAEISTLIKNKINDHNQSKSRNIEELADLFPDISDLKSGTTANLKWRKKPERVAVNQFHRANTGTTGDETVVEVNPEPGGGNANGTRRPKNNGTKDPAGEEVSVLKASRVMRISSDTIVLSLHLTEEAIKKEMYFALLSAGEQYVDPTEYLPISSASSKSLVNCEVSDNVIKIHDIVSDTILINVTLKGEIPYTGYSIKEITLKNK